jgi:8-oxo-dGTP pyrophosphatase MutT (NUDIX family)
VGETKTTKKPLKREFSAGGIVYKRNRNGDTSWLIIKPAGKDRWQFPKGLIDKGESSEQASLREVKEEGAVEAKIIAKVEDERLFYLWEGEKILKNVRFYLMEFVRNSDKDHDEEVDDAIFVPYSEAYAKLTFKNDKKVFEKAKEIFDQGVQGNLI